MREEPPISFHALPLLLAGALAATAPWLLGGRAENADAILGALAWATAISVLLPVVAAYREWKPTAAYEARRGRGTPNPLRIFGMGLLRALPLWGFIGLMGVAALNPAYAWDGDSLVRQAYTGWLPLVIDPQRSRPGIFLLTGLVAAVALLLNPALRPSRRLVRILLGVLLVNAVLLAWVGLTFRFAGNGLVLGRFEPRASYFFATFYYKNHWAAYALLYCGVAAFFFFRDLPRWSDNARRAGSGGLALIAILCLGLTFPVADTRSGILLFALFALLFLTGLFRRLHRGGLRTAVLAAMAAGAAGFVALSAADLQSAWQRTEQQIDKAGSPFLIDGIRAVHAPQVCLAMFRDRPLLGWGYRSYDPLFPVYATDYFHDDDGRLRMDMEFAHNDWLQHLAEFGVLGTGLLLGGLGLLLGGFPLGGLDPRRTGNPWIWAGIALLALFALWDFPFSNPAVLTNAAVLMVMGLQARRTRAG